jgi:hypothetical protein
MTKQKRSSLPKSTSTSWFASLSPTVQDLLCVAVLYGVALFLFRGGVFEDMKFSTAADDINSRINYHIGDTIRDTEDVVPLWFPQIFSGMPSFGSLSYIPQSVSYAELIVRNIARALFLMRVDSWIIAHYFMGGVFMFILVRRWGFSRSASLLAALTFMLSPYAIGLAGAGHGSKVKALSYLPLVFLLTHEAFTSKVSRRNLLTFGLLCAAIGTLLLTNHVQIVYYALMVIGLYALYRLLIDARENPRQIPAKAAMLAGTLVVALCIASYVYLSVYEYSQFSIRGGGTEGAKGGLTWEYATNWSMHPLELITLLIPSFFGFQSPYYWGSMPFTSSTIYLGVLPILLSVIALVYRRDRLTWFLFALTVLTLLMSFGKHFGFFYQLLFDYLPFFSKFRAPSTVLHLLPFTLGLLGAYGCSVIVGDPPKADAQRSTSNATQQGLQTQKLSKTLTIGLGIIAGLLILGALAKTSIYESFSGFMFVKEGELQQYQQQYGNRAVQIIEQLKRIRFFGNDQVSGLWGDYVRFSLVTIVLLGLVVGFLRKFLSAGVLAVGLFAVHAFDLLTMDSRFINPVPAASIENRLQPDPAVKFLQQQEGMFRVFPLGGDQFMDNTMAYHGINSIGGYSPAKLKIYQTMIDSCLYKGTDPRLPVNMNVVNMLNTRYVITPFQLPPDRFRVVYVAAQRDESTTRLVERNDKLIYENPAALPRTFFVKEVFVAKNTSEVFATLNSASFDPERTAIVEKPLSGPVGSPDSAVAEILEYKSRRIEVRAWTPVPALLVLSEVYYPAGWTATIDGSAAEIYKTNYILRSVLMPAGEHELVLTFEPSSYSIGRTVSHAAWALTFLCVGVGFWRMRSGRENLIPQKGSSTTS